VVVITVAMNGMDQVHKLKSNFHKFLSGCPSRPWNRYGYIPYPTQAWNSDFRFKVGGPIPESLTLDSPRHYVASSAMKYIGGQGSFPPFDQFGSSPL
jgi:hypothetical protein